MNEQPKMLPKTHGPFHFLYQLVGISAFGIMIITLSSSVNSHSDMRRQEEKNEHAYLTFLKIFFNVVAQLLIVVHRVSLAMRPRGISRGLSFSCVRQYKSFSDAEQVF